MLFRSLLQQSKIDPTVIQGYKDEKITHSEVAAAVFDSSADTGIGLEAAARAYGLDFIFLTLERYDLVMREITLALPPVQHLIRWLQSDGFHALLRRLGGYEHTESGQVEWV